jgi:hypothetical protein
LSASFEQQKDEQLTKRAKSSFSCDFRTSAMRFKSVFAFMSEYMIGKMQKTLGGLSKLQIEGKKEKVSIKSEKKKTQ